MHNVFRLRRFLSVLTGDIDFITNAHNLAMVALTARMQHERNYDDERLAKSGLKRIDIDPDQIQIKWAMDFCAQALRNIRIGTGRKNGRLRDGFRFSDYRFERAYGYICQLLPI